MKAKGYVVGKNRGDSMFKMWSFRLIFFCALIACTTPINFAPLSMVLSDEEVRSGEEELKTGNFSSSGYEGTFVFDGKLLSEEELENEKKYVFKIEFVWKNFGTLKAHEKIEIFAPSSLKNGGVLLKVGESYRIVAPFLPNHRFGLWRGTVIPLQKNGLIH